jgi:hypothetical protein
MSADDTPPLGTDEIEQAMAEAQARLVQTPAADIICNHVVGFFELAAIHLNATPPNLEEAAAAIDAMSAVVHTLEGRLGENESVMRDALQNIQFAFVQVKAAHAG